MVAVVIRWWWWLTRSGGHCRHRHIGGGGLCIGGGCQVRVYSGRGSGQVRTKTDERREQRAGQEISPAGVGDRLDSMTKDNKR